MTNLTLSLAMGNYDRTRAIVDGNVKIDGVDPVPMLLSPEEMFFRAFRHLAFDISELSLSSYSISVARGDPHYVAVPVFLSRAFRHTSVYIRTDKGIERPEDLKGRKIGIAEYQLSANVWVRGILQYRNTPGPDGRSPAQIVFGRPIRDTLPAHRRAFDLCWQRAADEADAAGSDLKNSEERRYNQHARDLPGLRVGSQVAVQNHNTKRWDRCGVITEVDHQRRRYFIRMPSGRVLTRNRRFLRQRYAYAEPPTTDSPAAALETRPTRNDTAPGQQLRRSSRIRRRPVRLIEEI